MALNAWEEVGSWERFLKGEWRVVRFYTQISGQLQGNWHHMLLRWSDSEKQLNLKSQDGYFQGLAEGDVITLKLFSTDGLTRTNNDSKGYLVGKFTLESVNRKE
jgi:hypothetical protein